MRSGHAGGLYLDERTSLGDVLCNRCRELMSFESAALYLDASDEVAEAMLWLWRTPKERERWGFKGREHAQNGRMSRIVSSERSRIRSRRHNESERNVGSVKDILQI